METVTFYSYKGGVGRSLAVANVANFYSMIGLNVFVLDLDLEAPGQHYKFALTNKEEMKKGLIDFIYYWFKYKSVDNALNRYVIEINKNTSKCGSIHLLPAGNPLESDYLQKLSKLDWHKKFYHNHDLEGISFFLNLKGMIEKKYHPDILLIDSRTGITEIGGVATSLLADKVVVLFMNNTENIDGTKIIVNCIRNVSKPDETKPIDIIPVLTRLPELLDDQEFNLKNSIIEKIGLQNESQRFTIIHTDLNLEVDENVVIGKKENPDESLLLADYLQLCLNISPDFFSTKNKNVEKFLKNISDYELSENKFDNLHEFYKNQIKAQLIITTAKQLGKTNINYESILKYIKTQNILKITPMSEIAKWERTFPELKEFWILLPNFLRNKDQDFFNAMFYNISTKNSHYLFFLNNENDYKKLLELAKRMRKLTKKNIGENIKYVTLKDNLLKELLKHTNYWIANPNNIGKDKVGNGYLLISENNSLKGGLALDNNTLESIVMLIKDILNDKQFLGTTILKND